MFINLSSQFSKEQWIIEKRNERTDLEQIASTEGCNEPLSEWKDRDGIEGFKWKCSSIDLLYLFPIFEPQVVMD